MRFTVVLPFATILLAFTPAAFATDGDAPELAARGWNDYGNNYGNNNNNDWNNDANVGTFRIINVASNDPLSVDNWRGAITRPGDPMVWIVESGDKVKGKQAYRLRPNGPGQAYLGYSAQDSPNVGNNLRGELNNNRSQWFIKKKNGQIAFKSAKTKEYLAVREENGRDNRGGLPVITTDDDDAQPNEIYWRLNKVQPPRRFMSQPVYIFQPPRQINLNSVLGNIGITLVGGGGGFRAAPSMVVLRNTRVTYRPRVFDAVAVVQSYDDRYDNNNNNNDYDGGDDY